MEAPDRSNRYETIEDLPSIGRTLAFAVREKASGCTAVMYRVPLAEGFDREVIWNDLRRESNWVDPRLPRLIDCWQTDDSISYVRLEHPGKPLLDRDGQALLETWGRPWPEELAWQTLAALAGMHDCAMSHKRLSSESYVITPTGLVFLRDTGTWKRINDRLSNAKGGGVTFSLVSNVERLDVASWAGMCASLICGEAFAIGEADGTLRATQQEVERMSTALSQSLENAALAEMMVTALGAYTNEEGGGFENAIAALAKFPRKIVA